MVDPRILTAALWAALMMVYLLGDVLRIFNGDFEPGKIGGTKLSQTAWLGIAAFMLIPIAMMLLSLVLSGGANKWLNIALSGLLLLFNTVGLPSYPGWYDRFLIVVGLGINTLTIIVAATNL